LKGFLKLSHRVGLVGMGSSVTGYAGEVQIFIKQKIETQLRAEQ
jgi:hypothetical protein